MPNRPWWLWFATASFIAYWILLSAGTYYPRETIGFSIYPPASIEPESPADRAGIRAGERIVSAIGLPIDDQIDWMAVGANLPTGVSTEWIVVRDGARVSLTMEPLSRSWFLPAYARSVRFTLLVSLVLGLLLAWRGDGRPTTLLAAALLCSIGCATVPLWPRSMAVQLRNLPLPLQILVWPAVVSSIMSPVLMFAFCALMPRRLMKPFTLAVVLLPIAALAGLVVVVAALIVYDPLLATRVPVPAWLETAGPLSYGACFMGAAALLVLSLRRSTDPTDRRRVKILVAGVASGALGLFAVAGVMSPAMRGPALIVDLGGLAFAGLPIAFAYATLRHRLFDLRIIVRQGLQYALARGAIGAVVPIVLLVLVGDVAMHRYDTLESIIYERGVGYIAVLIIVFAIYSKRHEWMDAIDRRFFREQYAAQQILKEVVQDVGASPSFNAAAQKVIGRIDSALHPVMAAVMTKPRTSTAFATIASSGAKTPPIPIDSPIARVARALGKPVAASALGLGGDIDLIVPIALDANDDDALLVLGPRKSEEPYSAEDKDLLATIAASLKLLMGRSPADMATMTAATGIGQRLLGNRYRLDRPIGEGGMGMVYAATDETLQRRVAIKVIRDQHLTGDALARFQHEARTAASLSHPHIVTIHDFGADETGSPYLVMELLEGESLRTTIKRGRIPATRAVAILAGLASAINAAHAKGVIHRDLKPENVFMIAETHGKILDYGIAKAIESTTTFATPGVMGTLAYMAPEQASGAHASPAWDVWALSVIAFEMLTGQHPFGGGLPIAAAIPIRTLAPELNESMSTAIGRALSVSPSERPGTAKELLDSLAV